MSAFPLTRVATETATVKVAKRTKDVTVAVVSVLNPATAARLNMAQDLGKPLRCAFRNGRLQVWTEEPR